jgi:hypothetical protein
VDKYALADLLTNTTIIALMNVLERLGLTKDVLKKIYKSKSMTLRFAASDSCSLLKEQTVDVRHPGSVETTENTETTGSFFGSTTKSTIHTFVKRVKEFHWEVKAQWEISIYSGTDIGSRMILDSRSSSMILIVQSETPRPPIPTQRDHVPIEVSLSWLLKHIDVKNLTSQFHIKVHQPDTKTPRRNKSVEAAMEFLSLFDTWGGEVHAYFIHVLQRLIEKNNPVKPSVSEANQPMSLAKLTAKGVFVPVLPLMEEEPPKEDISMTMSNSTLGFQSPGASTLNPKSPVLSCTDSIHFLDEQIRTLEVMQQSIAKAFPSRQLLKPISTAEASICALCMHSFDISRKYLESINYIESMLENQLIAAIGKRICTFDLDQFVKYHNARFLTPAPQVFCHSIRRPQRFPEGILSIESSGKDGKMEPIETHSREVDSVSGLKLALNSATTVELTGRKFLHGWLDHSFKDTPNSHFQNSTKSFELIGRARQFSSFMLVVGTMVGHDRLQPKDAIVIRDKDEIKIPLLLKEIPSSKEFKDAIESLSPEQQRFAKAYRSMQLESSVLGICVIQIKPQLEELLGLPHDSLTKEMKLTQDLMELFVDYQVPSDLLSYDGENHEDTTSDKVKNVKGHVQAVMAVIEGAKKKQLEDEFLYTDMAMEKRSQQTGPPLRSKGNTLKGSSGRGTRMMFASKSVEAQSAMEDGLEFLRSHNVKSSFDDDRPFDRPEMLGSAPQRGSFDVGGTVTAKSAARKSLANSFDASSATSTPVLQSDSAPDLSVEGNPESKQSGEQTGCVSNALDFTAMPKMLDATIEVYDKDGALRSTTINTCPRWTRSRQENLLTQAETQVLGPSEIKTEKDKAFDLLDALSRSGSLPIAHSELHVIICVTHRFENDVMGTVIQDNINPIEKLEMSTLLVASTVLGVPASRLLRHDADRVRLAASNPALLEASHG